MLWRILTAAPLRAETSVSVSTKEGLEEAEDLGEVAVDEVMVEVADICGISPVATTLFAFKQVSNH